ncbi:MAG: hypothetical protein KKB59_19275 [Spirochaetes bacterium]|nr:hypothetical protein [Spirochaetota bacterium]
MAVCGFSIAAIGVSIEQTNQEYTGLYLVLFGPLLACLSGNIATVASKFEAEGR